MRSSTPGWLVLVILLGTTAYAIAEQLTLTTYYPSPRGVYKELRVGSGNVPTPNAALQVFQPEDKLAVRIDTKAPTNGPVVVDQQGKLGVGTLTPTDALSVMGNASVTEVTSGTGQPNTIRMAPNDGAGNTSLEMRAQRTGGISYIDFANNPTADFDARIQSDFNSKANKNWLWLRTTNPKDRSLAGDLSIHADRVGISPNQDPEVATPQKNPVPNGQGGNLNVNDIYLRASNEWVSKITGSKIQSGYQELAHKKDPKQVPEALRRSGSTIVTFAKPFTKPPHVIITTNFQVWSKDEDLVFWIEPATTTKFRISWRGADDPLGHGGDWSGCQDANGASGDSCGFHWIAVEGTSDRLF